MREATLLDRAAPATDLQVGSAAAGLARDVALQPANSAPALPRVEAAPVAQPVVRHRRRISPLLASLLGIVVIPTILSGLYFTLIASQSYLTEFRATVRSVQPALEASGMSALLGMAGASQSANDANAVVQYLQSRDALEEINKRVSLQASYASSDVDWLSRLKSNATIEEFVRYWRHQLDAYFETTTGTIVVRISAFSPEAALSAGKAALALSEDLVNQLSARTRNDTVSFAARTVDEAERRLTGANARMRLVQDQQRVLDPQKEAASTLALSAKLKDELAGLNSTLAVQRSYMNGDAPSVRITQEQIAGLQREIDKLNASTTDTGGGDVKPLSSILGLFDQAETERGFAEKSYAAALAALQAARLEASRQQVYLATIVRPELPQEANFPRPIINTATVFGIALAIWLIGLLSSFAIREHT